MAEDNKSCEKCKDSDEPEWNAVADSSPCGKHTACGENELFEYSAISDTDRCVKCSAGKAVAKKTHFDRSCTACNIASAKTYSSGCAVASCEPGFKPDAGAAKCEGCGVANVKTYSSGCVVASCEPGFKPDAGAAKCE